MTIKKNIKTASILVLSGLLVAAIFLRSSPASAAIMVGRMYYAKYNDTTFTQVLYSSNTDGSDERKLADDTISLMNASAIAVSPDESKIAFAAYNSVTNSKNRIYVVNSDGSNLTAIPNSETLNTTCYTPTQSPAFSPDGTKIIFAKECGLTMVNSDGTNMREVVSRPTGNTDYNATYPTFVDDSTKVLFRALDDTNTRTEYFIVDTATNNTPTMVNDSVVNNKYSYVLSAGGTKITYFTLTGGTAHIKQGTLSGSTINITNSSTTNLLYYGNFFANYDTTKVYFTEGSSRIERGTDSIYGITQGNNGAIVETAQTDSPIFKGSVSPIAFPVTTIDNATAKNYTINESLNSYNYPIRNTDLTIGQNGSTGNVIVYKGSKLRGTGRITGTLTVMSGGEVLPGNSPGCMSAGSTTYSGTLTAELGGTTACSGYDQLQVTGSLTLNNATLDVPLYNSYVPSVNSVYTIITNDGSDAVSGTFNGLAEGASFSSNGHSYKISYVGGDGNDVTITYLGTATQVPTNIQSPNPAQAAAAAAPANPAATPNTGLAKQHAGIYGIVALVSILLGAMIYKQKRR